MDLSSEVRMQDGISGKGEHSQVAVSFICFRESSISCSRERMLPVVGLWLEGKLEILGGHLFNEK